MNYQYYYIEEASSKGKWSAPFSLKELASLIFKKKVEGKTWVVGPDCENKPCRLEDYPNNQIFLDIVSSLLDQLWTAQRNAILSKVQGGPPDALDQKLRTHKGVSTYELVEYLITRFWQRTSDSILEKEITKRHIGKSPVVIGNLSPVEDEDELRTKLDKVFSGNPGWMGSRGCYSFHDSDSTLYVGKAARGLSFIGHRIRDHFQSGKDWAKECTEIRLWQIKSKPGTDEDEQRSRELERLLYLWLDPELNEQGMSQSNPIDDILLHIRNEIRDLATDA